MCVQLLHGRLVARRFRTKDSAEGAVNRLKGLPVNTGTNTGVAKYEVGRQRPGRAAKGKRAHVHSVDVSTSAEIEQLGIRSPLFPARSVFGREHRGRRWPAEQQLELRCHCGSWRPLRRRQML